MNTDDMLIENNKLRLLNAELEQSIENLRKQNTDINTKLSRLINANLKLQEKLGLSQEDYIE